MVFEKRTDGFDTVYYYNSVFAPPLSRTARRRRQQFNYFLASYSYVQKLYFPIRVNIIHLIRVNVCVFKYSRVYAESKQHTLCSRQILDGLHDRKRFRRPEIRFGFTGRKASYFFKKSSYTYPYGLLGDHTVSVFVALRVIRFETRNRIVLFPVANRDSPPSHFTKTTDRPLSRTVSGHH